MRFLIAGFAAFGAALAGVTVFTDLPDIVFPPDYRAHMALAGHGQLMNAEGEWVDPSPEVQRRWHMALYRDVMDMPVDFPEPDLADADAQISEFLAADDLTEEDALFLRALQIRTRAEGLSEEERSEISWRNDFLLGSLTIGKKFTPKEKHTPPVTTLRNYMRVLYGEEYSDLCRSKKVPFPPDFGQASGHWTFQGRPKINLNVPSRWLEIWTWTDPNIRGACIALPREGANGQVAATGIICQGAETGHACFWDSNDPATGLLLPWDEVVVPIHETKNGTQLNGCADCHHGSNAFLVPPDDPTWCILMRGGLIGRPGQSCRKLDGNPHKTFTMQVEGLVNPIALPNTNPPVMMSRYIPIGGGAGLLEWKNDAKPGCGLACHLEPATGLGPTPVRQRIKMPPVCGSNCTHP